MKKKLFFVILVIISFFASCASSNSSTTFSNGANISRYKYVVFGSLDDGDSELDDIIIMVQNEISNRLKVVSRSQALELLRQGDYVLTPKISVKSEKWDGGHSYITISFYDFDTNQYVAVVKSSGIGLSINEDQKLALKALIKELDKTFKN